MLNDLLLAHAVARGRRAEGIEIHGDEIDRRDSLCLDRLHVLRTIASREQSTVHGGMQRLHASVEHLGDAGDVADIARREAGVAQRAGRATGRDDLPPELGEPARELDDAGLVGDGDEGAHQGASLIASAAIRRDNERMSRRSITSAGEWL